MVEIPTRFWVVAILFSVWVNYEIVTNLNNAFLVVALELLFALAVFIGIRWADAYESEPIGVMIWALIAGSGISVQLVVFFYTYFEAFTSSIPVAAFVEESMKAALLLIPYIYRQIDSWTDGLVYGAMIGLGFSVAEDVYYAFGVQEETQMIIYRGFSSIFAHSVFSGIVGALAVYGLKLSAYKWITIGLLVGTILHSIWNFSAGLSGTFVTLFMAFMTPAAFIALAVFLRDQERKILELQAELAVKAGKLEANQATIICDLRQRKIVKRSLSPDRRELFDKRTSRQAKELFMMDLT